MERRADRWEALRDELVARLLTASRAEWVGEVEWARGLLAELAAELAAEARRPRGRPEPER